MTIASHAFHSQRCDVEAHELVADHPFERVVEVCLVRSHVANEHLQDKRTVIESRKIRACEVAIVWEQTHFHLGCDFVFTTSCASHGTSHDMEP